MKSIQRTQRCLRYLKRQLATGRRQEMVRVPGSQSINLTRVELDALARALQFEADVMTAAAMQFRGERRSSLAAIAEANRVLIAILKAEWGEP
jgi:hypothetical protein